MKKLATLLLATAFTFTAFAEETESYAYVIKSNVNLRSEPSTQSKVHGKASKGDIYRIENIEGDWLRIEVFENMMDSYFPCISSQFVKILNNNPVTEDALSSTFSFEDGDLFGVLFFEKENKDEWGNDRYRYTKLIKNREFMEQGGTGVVDNTSECVLYIDNIMQPEDFVEYPVVYDKEQGLLWYAGFLWKEDK